MPPKQFPSHWQAARLKSPLGTLLLAASPKGLSGCWFTGKERLSAISAEKLESYPAIVPAQEFGTSLGIAPQAIEATRILHLAARELYMYFLGTLQEFQTPLDPQGTPFQLSIWKELLNIPYGQVTTYATVAANVGRPRSIRAAANAIGSNPLSIIVPCHRVIGSNGRLTGYGGGLNRKKELLTVERIRIPLKS